MLACDRLPQPRELFFGLGGRPHGRPSLTDVSGSEGSFGLRSRLDHSYGQATIGMPMISATVLAFANLVEVVDVVNLTEP